MFIHETPDAWIQYRDTHLISSSAVVVYLRHKRLHLPELSWRSILVLILCVYLSVQTQRFGVHTQSENSVRITNQIPFHLFLHWNGLKSHVCLKTHKW